MRHYTNPSWCEKNCMGIKKHILLIDTREQLPLSFFHPDIKSKRETVYCGDYAMRFRNGRMSRTEFERKSRGALFGTMTGGTRGSRKSWLKQKKPTCG